MGENPERIKDLQYSFSSFLWKNLIGVQEKWDEGNVYEALAQVLSLVKYLPVKIKDELEEDVDKIEELVNKSFNAEASDFQSTMLARNKQIDKIARFYFPKFVNKMMTLLDKRGYLERGLWNPITKEDLSKFEAKQNESQVDQE